MTLASPLADIKGVGSAKTSLLGRLGLTTVDQLINYYPRRYEDYSLVQTISKIRPGQVTLEVQINSVVGRYVRRGMHLTEAIARDKTGSVRLIWFNQPYRADSIKTDSSYYVSGTFELRRQRFSIINPSIELKSSFPVNTARIVPKYRETKGLTSSELRRLIRELAPAITDYPESLPKEIVKDYHLMPLSQALFNIHFPESAEALNEAKQRIGFEEVFCLVLASELNKLQLSLNKSPRIKFNQPLAQEFVAKLPFTLTPDQRRTIWQVYLDIDREQPMNRLIEGDVGSGKTVVALMSGLMVLNQNYQVALMAPTELLARQHADSIYKLLQPLGLEDQVCLLIGSLNAKQKKRAADSIASGKAGFIIGTHALIQDKLAMNNLGLIIIDEQHRFGVVQRQKLQLKAKTMPHLLSLSATPIPRSLALTLFGELNISRLVDKPSNRLPIMTKIISEAQYKRTSKTIMTKLKAGDQMYIVCPSIEAEGESQSVKNVYLETKKIYSEYKVGFIHGKLSAEEKEKTMSQFLNKQLDILVATTVIEVGIDVANATIMVIKDSDNFGLAQLHQLRGRVGRGSKQGICFLIYDDAKQASNRLKALESSNDGFELAELDLELRGPGAIYGRSQHGALDLRMAELSDTRLIKKAREAAKYFVANKLDLLQYSQLENKVTKLQKMTNLN